jgi:poly-gamma-glutamate capsule biosynthesis protein CapA/YwtB (metallophosphatase superfamily)
MTTASDGGGGAVTLFLCGDVMTGRGIDQVLPHPGDPRLHESRVRDARRYVELAEEAGGRIPGPVDFAYPWGDARPLLDRMGPELRIINLETAVTTRGRPWPDKGIHYRMHPRNLPCLAAARIDCCVLANNHLLDWGREGLDETLAELDRAGLAHAGAGRDAAAAARPAVLPLAGGRRVLVFALGHGSSGIPPEWAAGEGRSGVNRVADLSRGVVTELATRIRAVKRAGDLVVASVHWGSNWGYAIPGEQQAFARALIDRATVDIVHGHSSHHPRAIEVHRGKPVFYGCGDFLNDYEGIGGHAEFRGELALMYFVTSDPADGRLLRLELVPMRIRGFQARRAGPEDAAWLQATMDRECRRFGGRVLAGAEGRLVFRREHGD